MKIALVAGEASGDFLAANLMASLKQHYPDVCFIGIAGPKMQQQGMASFFPFDKLSVVGLFDIIHRLPDLLASRRRLAKYIVDEKPDLFIGVDAPDFNLDLESYLRRQGIKVIHYVSPSIWAWRRWRWRKVKQAVDHLLCLFPFEIDFYRQYQINATCVGHPLANEIPMQSDKHTARQHLGINNHTTTLALLPGSRLSEIKQHMPLFLQTAVRCQQQVTSLQCIIPAANETCKKLIEQIVADFTEQLTIHVIDEQARTAMAAADVVLLASGTATLECALIKRPMVVAYRLSALNYHVGVLFKATRYLALPNILTGHELVPEFIQYRAIVDNLAPAVLNYLQRPANLIQLQKSFVKLHQSLKLPTDVLALDAIDMVLQTR